MCAKKNFDLRRNHNTLPPEKLMTILCEIYPEDVAKRLYRNLTGEEPPERCEEGKE